MPRRLYALGSTHVPETSRESRNGSARHPCLEAIWDHTLRTGGLWYAPNRPGAMNGPPGSKFGLYALKYVVRGTECEGMDQRIAHVASLDTYFAKPGVSVKRAAGCGPVRLLLLSDGTLLTLSENTEWHGVRIPSPDPSTFIVDAAGGEGHYACCDSNGSLYTWGWNNEFGQLGQGGVSAADTKLIGVHKPRRLPGFGELDNAAVRKAIAANPPPTVFETRLLPGIVAVACGRHHTVALTDSRCSVYTFGKGTSGQLGLGRPTGGAACVLKRIDLLPTPRCVPCVFGSSIREIICVSDGDSTMIVLETGTLVVWGDNTTGFFGTGSAKTVFVPTPIELPPVLDNLESNATAKSATAAARSAQYGSIESYLNPRRIKPLLGTASASGAAKPSTTSSAAPVVLASASLSHSAVSDGCGRLLTAGLRPLRVARNNLPVNALGALGRKLTSKADALSFGIVEGIHVDDDDRIACGDGFTCYLMRRQGLVFIMGSIAVDGTIIVGGGEEAHDMYCINVGVGRRVADIFTACNGGLFLVVDDV